MADDAAPPPAPPPAAPDPAEILRSRDFVKLLLFAAVVGIVVSLVGWAFLELVHKIQVWVFTDLPDDMGYSSPPSWFYLIVLALAGLPVAFAIERMPGAGGHVPAKGLQAGGTEPNMLPGVLLAGLATLGLGIVLGPEGPLIAIGAGLAVFCVQKTRGTSQPQLALIMAAAGSLAAISVIFGSPIIAAILVLEVAGIGGPMVPLILIPGLVAAGIGSLVFIGMTHWTGLNTSAYTLVPLQLAPLSHVTWAEIGWTIALGLAGAVFTQVVRRLSNIGAGWVPGRAFVIAPVAGLAVAALAILFSHTTTHGADQVLFSGQEALPGLVSSASTWSLGALLMVLLCKGLAWTFSLSAFRGGPTFPAIYLGAAGGVAASHLPGMPQTAGVAVGIGIMVVAFLKIPLSAILIATVLTVSAGLAVGALIIVGVVVSYLATLGLEGRLGDRMAARAASAGNGTAPAT
jgi:H+/Cl- antiporter ClcA